MSGIEITRRDLTAADLRAAAGKCRDAKAARRMLALALVLDGVDRTRAAETCGMDRQTLRDWVHRYNAEGLPGLSDRWKGVRVPYLAPAQMAGLGARVEAGSRLGRTRSGTGWCAGAGRTCNAGSPWCSGSKCTNAPSASIWRRSAIAGFRCARSTRRVIRTRRWLSKKLPRGGSSGDPRGCTGQTA